MFTATPSKPAIRPSALQSYTYDALDNLLFDWFLWDIGYAAVSGYAGADAACDKFVSSHSFDDVDEVIQARVNAYVMPTISHLMEQLDGDHRVAITIEMRNRMGPKVWKNPRAGDRQPEAYQAAKLAIAPILRRKGVEF